MQMYREYSFEHPAKLFDYTLVGIILQGKMELGINLKRYVFQVSSIMFWLDNQIIQYINSSDDFSGLFMVFSKYFTKSIQLNSHQLAPLFLYLKDNPATSLEKEELSLLLDCYALLHKIIKNMVGFNQMEIVIHLSEVLKKSPANRLITGLTNMCYWNRKRFLNLPQ
jgi:hypothetical protein